MIFSQIALNPAQILLRQIKPEKSVLERRKCRHSKEENKSNTTVFIDNNTYKRAIHNVSHFLNSTVFTDNLDYCDHLADSPLQPFLSLRYTYFFYKRFIIKICRD